MIDWAQPVMMQPVWVHWVVYAVLLLSTGIIGWLIGVDKWIIALLICPALGGIIGIETMDPIGGTIIGGTLLVLCGIVFHIMDRVKLKNASKGSAGKH